MKKNKNIIFKDVIKKNHINNKIFLKDKKQTEKTKQNATKALRRHYIVLHEIKMINIK